MFPKRASAPAWALRNVQHATTNNTLQPEQKPGVDLKKKDKLVLWPAYFDSTKTRLEGRRVPKNLGVPTPKLIELQEAVKQANFEPEVIVDAKHPSVPWQKTGIILVPKGDSKTQILRRVAERLFKVRNRSRSAVRSRKGLN